MHLWLPIGGHIELDEDPEEAAIREAREESGLDVTLCGTRPTFAVTGTKALIPPIFLDIHSINKTHKHVALMYLATTTSNKVTLAQNEHTDIRWFSQKDLDNLSYNLKDSIKYYAKQALKIMR